MNTRLLPAFALCLHFFAAWFAAAQDGLKEEPSSDTKIRRVLDRLLANRLRIPKEFEDQRADICWLAKALGEESILYEGGRLIDRFDLIQVAELRFRDGPATVVIVDRPSNIIPGDNPIAVWLFNKLGKRIGRQLMILNSRQKIEAKVTCRVIGGRQADSAWIILELEGSEERGLGEGVWMSLRDEKGKRIEAAKWNGVDISSEGRTEVRRTMAIIEATPKGLEFR